jgi:hypothetical protein
MQKISICRKYQYEVRVGLKRVREDIVSRLCYGSQATVEEGVAATRQKPLGCNERWFADSSTIILGSGEIKGETQVQDTVATWHVPVEPEIVRKVKSGFLIIACERPQGGLHTQEYGATAKVEINGNNRDIIGLKDIPPGHTDYFHRVPVPRIPDVWPISGCGTVYAWPIHPAHLQESGKQTVRVEIDRNVSWDIDYVLLALTTDVSFLQIPSWLEKLIYALIGAALGAIAKVLIAG